MTLNRATSVVFAAAIGVARDHVAPRAGARLDAVNTDARALL